MGRAEGAGAKKEPTGRGCANIWYILRVVWCQLDSPPIASGDVVVRHWVQWGLRGVGGKRRAGTGGEASGDVVLRRRRHGRLVGPHLAAGRV